MLGVGGVKASKGKGKDIRWTKRYHARKLMMAP